MTTYWVMYLLPVLGFLFDPRMERTGAKTLLAFFLFLWVLVIGFRSTIGCDWDIYEAVYTSSLSDRFTIGALRKTFITFDPGYILLNWVSGYLGTGIYGVNVACGMLIIYGVHRLVQDSPYPWLSWSIATPYFLVVVAMGYSRQAVAIGLLCWTLALIRNRLYARSLIVTVIAITFHRSFLVIVPFILFPLVNSTSFLTKRSSLIATATILGILCVSLLYVFSTYNFSLDPFQWAWTDAVIIRTGLSAIPACFFLYCFYQKLLPRDQFSQWVALSWFALVIFLFAIFMPPRLAPTAIDRIALYTLPLQLFLWPIVINALKHQRLAYTIGVSLIFFYGTVLYVWLNFAQHANCWVPYYNALFRYNHVIIRHVFRDEWVCRLEPLSCLF